MGPVKQTISATLHTVQSPVAAQQNLQILLSKRRLISVYLVCRLESTWLRFSTTDLPWMVGLKKKEKEEEKASKLAAAQVSLL